MTSSAGGVRGQGTSPETAGSASSHRASRRSSGRRKTDVLLREEPIAGGWANWGSHSYCFYYFHRRFSSGGEGEWSRDVIPTRHRCHRGFDLPDKRHPRANFPRGNGIPESYSLRVFGTPQCIPLGKMASL